MNTRERFELWIAEALATPEDCWICEAWGFSTPATSPPCEHPTCDACQATPLPISSGPCLLVEGDAFSWGGAK